MSLFSSRIHPLIRQEFRSAKASCALLAALVMVLGQPALAQTPEIPEDVFAPPPRPAPQGQKTGEDSNTPPPSQPGVLAPSPGTSNSINAYDTSVAPPPVSVSATFDFGTSEVQVDATAATATEARTQAIAKGEADALASLLLRLNSAQAGAVMQRLKPEQISNMVRGFEVKDERIAANRYRALIRYSFDPDKVHQIADAMYAASPATAAPGSEQTNGTEGKPGTAPATRRINSPALLVVPLLRQGAETVLWDPRNNWRSAFNIVALEKGRGLLVMPYGDPIDQQALTADNVLRSDYTSITPVMERYGAGEAAIVTATPLTKNALPAVEISLYQITPSGAEKTKATFISQVNETYEMLLTRAAQEVTGRLVKYAEDRLAGNFSGEPGGPIPAVIRVPRAADWRDIKRRLEMLTAVDRVEITGIEFQRLELAIYYRGAPAYLGKSLVAAGFEVGKENNRLSLAAR